MKHTVVAISFVFATAVAPPATAEPKWTLQVDPLTTALGFVHVQVERTLGEHASVYLGPSLRLFSPPFSDAEDYVGYGAEAGARWYFLGGAPRGWWALARGVAAHLQTTANGSKQTAAGGYASLLGGYTFILADWLVLSAGLGAQYFFYEVGGLGLSGPFPALHTTVGVAF